MGRGLVSAFVVIAILAFPVASFAQEAAIGGTVKDSTSGVLPGVAIQAVHEATGTVFETVTDELDNGIDRLRASGLKLSCCLLDFQVGSNAASITVLNQFQSLLVLRNGRVEQLLLGI